MTTENIPVEKQSIIPEKQERRDSNVVYIGEKPFMNYVTGVVMQLTTKNFGEVVIKARGKFISRAVDVAEVVTKRFLENTAEIKHIATGSEDFTNKEGRNVRVSFIELSIVKK